VCAGLDVAIYDPELDPDGTGAKLLTDLLVDVLTPSPDRSGAVDVPTTDA
jgi:hypothetical protein